MGGIYIGMCPSFAMDTYLFLAEVMSSNRFPRGVYWVPCILTALVFDRIISDSMSLFGFLQFD